MTHLYGTCLWKTSTESTICNLFGKQLSSESISSGVQKEKLFFWYQSLNFSVFNFQSYISLIPHQNYFHFIWNTLNVFQVGELDIEYWIPKERKLCGIEVTYDIFELLLDARNNTNVRIKLLVLIANYVILINNSYNANNIFCIKDSWQMLENQWNHYRNIYFIFIIDT